MRGVSCRRPSPAHGYEPDTNATTFVVDLEVDRCETATTPGPALQATATQVAQLVEGEAPITAKARESYNGAWHATVAGTKYAEEAERAAFLLAYTKERPGGATDSLAEFLDGSARVRAASEREASGLLVAIMHQLNADQAEQQRARTNALLGGRKALDVLGQDEDYEVVKPRFAGHDAPHLASLHGSSSGRPSSNGPGRARRRS
jgi:hypothetical protein